MFDISVDCLRYCACWYIFGFFRYNLGKVLEALKEYEKASNAMATALMEEKNSPILPFNSVPLCFE